MQITPPVAPHIDHQELRHGEVVVDEYYWLREKSNSEVIRYLEAENAYTAALTEHLLPAQDALYNEMLARIKETDLSVPVKRGPWSYYSRTEAGKQYPIQCRRLNIDDPEQVLLDVNQLALGHDYVGLGGMVLSDDQNLLAYTADFTGFRQYTLFIKDLRTGATLTDTAERVTSLEWAADNNTIFFTTEDHQTKRSDTLWRHIVGSPSSDPVYEEPDELYDITLAKTRDRKFLLLKIEAKDTTEFLYLQSAKPADAFQVFLPREKGHRYFPDHRENLFYIRTDKGAVNFRIVTAPDTDPAPPNWTEFIPHQADVLNVDIDLFRDFAVVVEKSEALNHLRVYSFREAVWSSIAFPEPVYTALPAGTPDYDSSTYRYSYESLVTPPCVFDYDTRTEQSQLLKQQEVLGGYDPSLYRSERLWATARDGVNVPISIVYKDGVARDGTAPLFLYAYGSYGYGMSASFSSARLSLLDRGVIYAIAHIRGGDEMGEHWRLNGMLMNKKNTFFDFIDCTAWLIAERWTSSDRVVIEGGSAGGLLMGAVVNLRPDLFHAVHSAVPFVDVVNTMMDASLPLTVGEYLEWGDPNDKAAYDYIRSYSPYDNLKSQSYPAMLVTTSLNDSQVMYWEPAKYVARLRTLKTDSNPLLLKVKMDPAGHGGASGRYDRLKDLAFEYAWILDQIIAS